MAIRKTGRATSTIPRPLFRGVLITDPRGTPTTIAFTGDAGDALLGDGTFGSVPATGVAWGDITGTLSDQTDLQAALDAKQDRLVFDDDLGAYVLPRL
jgi:hypothetical protein